MDQEDYADDFDEDGQDGENLPGVRHVQEDSENVEGQQRNYGCLYGFHDYAFKVMGSLFERVCFKRCQSQAEDECKDKSCHDVHQRWYVDGEEWSKVFARCDRIKRRRCIYHRRENCCTSKIGYCSCKNGGTVCYGYGEQKHFSCPFPNVCNSCGDQPEYDERNGES